MEVGVEAVEISLRERMFVVGLQRPFGVLGGGHQLFAHLIGGRAVPVRGAERIVVDTRRQHMARHRLQAFGVAGGGAEGDLFVFLGVVFEAQVAEYVLHGRAKTQRHAGDQVIGHAPRRGLQAVVQGPAEDMLLAGPFRVEGLELLVAWRFRGAQQHAVHDAAGVRAAQHPQVLKLCAVQRQGIGPHGGGAELRVGAFAQTLKQLQVALQQMTLQVGDIRQCDDTLIKHVLDRAPHFCPAMQIALRIGEVQARLQGGHLLRQPGDVQILIGRWQGRILVGEDGVGEEVGARLFIVGVQAAQGQLDQRAVVIVMADIGDEASGADQ